MVRLELDDPAPIVTIPSRRVSLLPEAVPLTSQKILILILFTEHW